MSAAVVMAWLATMSLLAWRGRPHPAPLIDQLGPRPDTAPPRTTRPGEPHISAIEQLGSLVQRRIPSLLAVPARSIGLAALVGVVLLPISAGWALGGAVATGTTAWWRQRSAAQRRRRQLERDLPAVVELLRLAIDAGLSTRMSLATLSPHLDGELAAVLRRTMTQLDRGESLAVALRAAGGRVGPPFDDLAAVLAAAEHTGAAVGPLLSRFADDLRRSQRVASEARARRLPVVLLLPLVFCVLPAFVIVAVVPMLATGTAAYSFPSP